MNFPDIDNEEWLDQVRTFMTDLSTRYMPGISVNIVVFHYNAGRLCLLLMRFADTGQYMLPGGYVLKEEDLDDAAIRCLTEWTGKGNLLPEQFYTTGKVNRAAEQTIEDTIRTKLPGIFENWLSQRKVSVCYYTMTDSSDINPSVIDYFISESRWSAISDMPDLLFDHKLIIEKAVLKLQADLDKKLLEYNMLPKEFTMGDLQKLYEAVFQRSFTRANFQRRMLSLGILERLGKKFDGGAHKAPYLYRVKSV
jgi:ADP-ribose pyrophosphatase YjhB (NUDIX family)